jgi:hypothetical protein
MVAPTMGRLGLEARTAVHQRRDAGELTRTRWGKRHGAYLRGGDAMTSSGEARAISGFLHDGKRTGQMRRAITGDEGQGGGGVDA